MEIIVPETRGRKPKYDFTIEVGQTISFPKRYRQKIRTALAAYILRNKLEWQVKTWTDTGFIHIARIK